MVVHHIYTRGAFRCSVVGEITKFPHQEAEVAPFPHERLLWIVFQEFAGLLSSVLLSLHSRNKMGDRYRNRDRSPDRGGRKRDRGDSFDRDSTHVRAEDEILSVLKNVRALPQKTLDEIREFAHKIDAMRIEDKGRGETKDLFVGNLVDEDVSTVTLKLLLNTAMQRLGLVGPGEEPVLNCRMSNKYCFIEFRSTTDSSMAINLAGIPFKNYALKLGRPAKYGGPTHSLYTWQDLLPLAKAAAVPVAVPSSTPLPITKLYREIFVGNTNDKMTELGMKELVGGAMMKMGLSHSRYENPVHQVKLTGKFAFMEMRTCVDAANVLNLTGIPYCGNSLNIVRTNKYDGGCGIEAYLTWDALYQKWVEGDLRLITAGTPTRVLVITNVTTPETLAANPTLYLDIIEDMRLECGQTGLVKSVIVPRTQPAGDTGRSPVGKVFVEMDTVDQAIETLMMLKVGDVTCSVVCASYYCAFADLTCSADGA
jgi:hypothetical protein